MTTEKKTGRGGARAGAGRKRISDQPRKTIYTTIDANVYAQLSRVAALRCVSMSEITNRALEEYLRGFLDCAHPTEGF